MYAFVCCIVVVVLQCNSLDLEFACRTMPEDSEMSSAKQSDYQKLVEKVSVILTPIAS